MARKTLLTPDLQKKIIKLLETGVSIDDACSRVGISDRTYYNWRDRGQEAANQLEQALETDPDADVPTGELLFFQFFQATTRALKNAKIEAIGAVYGSIKGFKTKSVKTVVFKETRLRKGEKGVEEPYEYQETTTTTTIAQHAPDPHTAIEYLKRRYPDEWIDRLRIDLDPALLKELEGLATRAKVDLNDLIKAVVDELKASGD